MTIAIIQFPGSNCESESIRAVRMADMSAEEFLWNQDYAQLNKFDGFFIVGGFSYEDRSRSGVIAAQDPLMKHIKAQSEKGKPVLGICNGAQILVETGMAPGLKDNKVGMALAPNNHTGFYSTWVNIVLDATSGASAFTRNLKKGDIIKIPIAHGEGRFIIPNELLDEMIKNRQTAFRYCDKNGKIKDEFPINPNGAIYNLAAVTNAAGNVMAMMPHPERASEGQAVFTSMRDYISENKKIKIAPLSYTPPKPEIKNYKPPENSKEMLINLIITDNTAVSVSNSAGAPLKKQTHWEIEFAENANTSEIMKKIIDTGELFNSNKELISSPLTACASYLVRYKDDFEGKSKLKTLQEKFKIKGIKSIKKGVLWHILNEHANIEMTLLFNQFSQKCFKYNGL